MSCSYEHSCVICTEEEHNKWKSGEYLYHEDYRFDEFVTIEEAKKRFKKEFPDDDFDEDRFEYWCEDNDYYTMENWGGEDKDLYEFDTTTRVINGTKIYVHCYYGDNRLSYKEFEDEEW